MDITVLGGTGRTGRHVVQQALAQGHSLTLLVRDPTKAQELRTSDGRVTLVPGDLGDEASVALAVRGADAVVSAAGPVKGSSTDLMESGARSVVRALREHGVGRLVWLTGAGVRRPGDRPGAVDRLIVGVMTLVQAAVLRDSRAGVDVVTAADDLGWTVVRAPRLTDSSSSGSRRVVPKVGGGHGTLLPREELGAFLVELATGDAWRHEAPVISS